MLKNYSGGILDLIRLIGSDTEAHFTDKNIGAEGAKEVAKILKINFNCF